MLLESLGKQDTFCIYGAQVVAYGAYKAILELTGRKPVCFAVKNLEGNPSEIEGIPVCQIVRVSKDIFLIAAVTELVLKDVLPELGRAGFRQVFPFSAHEEHFLMSAYYKKIGRFCSTQTNFAVYEVHNHNDKPLANHPELNTWEIPIQAGAALTDRIISVVRDNEGENISSKNKQYCEMTAVYWVWKNAKHDWVGIEHYRRHLLITPDMLAGDVDAALPLPYMCYPNEIAQFRRFVSEGVLDTLKNVLLELHPGEYKGYMDIMEQPYQYTYNLLCARWDVFEDYCSWFFEITERMEMFSENVPEIKSTRALSYVAEVLTNLYFMSRKGTLSIRHVEKSVYT